MADYTPSMGRGGRYDRGMYYRRPDKGEDRRWIIIGSRTAMEQMIERGFEPLRAVGYIAAPDPEKWYAEHNYDWTPWAQILTHPGGPDLFPAEQVLAYRWYRAEDCPVPGIQWKQLSGYKVMHYKCPECERPPFPAVNGTGGIEPLARHLRLFHSWDRASLVKYGEKVGIDFDAIYSSVTESFEFEVGKEEAEGCDECDWTTDPEKKNPAAALRMHKRAAHPALEVAEVG